MLQEFLDADVIVIGAPMYNFGVPSTLKAWIDRVAVAGKTFRYTESGPQGLAGGKKVIIASSRGGAHQESGGDFQESYLRFVFGFLGITDIEIVRAEGLAMSPQHRTDAMAAAHASIRSPLAEAAVSPCPAAEGLGEGRAEKRPHPPWPFSRSGRRESGHSMRSTPPMYGRSTSGTVIEPSAFW